MDKALTVKEIAMLLQVDAKTVYRLSQRGELPGFKVAGAWRFKRTDMDSWIECQKTVARGAVSAAAKINNKEFQ